jgi:putative ABC transport system permease protein
MPIDDSAEVIVGSVIRSSLSLTIGSTIETGNTTLTVVGYLSETGSVDDYSVFMPLDSAQAMLNHIGEISLVDVGALCNNCPVEAISQQIMNVLPNVKATPVRQAVETRMKTVEQTANFSLLLASIILVVGCAGVMNTMLASVHERMKEIGVLMSLGADNSHLYRLFLFESAILGLIGGFLGTIVGLVASMLFGPFFLGTSISPAETPIYIFPLVIFLSVSTCIAASLYPTWRASRIDPVKALRSM